MKIINVESCSKCPYGRSDHYRDQFMKAWCGHPQMAWTNNNWEWHSKVIEKESEYLSFPSWCPLENFIKTHKKLELKNIDKTQVIG